MTKLSRMKVFVGTSGFSYSWNPDGLEWYLKRSGLNSLELNASFYCFPFPNQVKSWAKKTMRFSPNLRWAIKVNRFVTHVFKLGDRAYQTWMKFKKLFEPLDDKIDFYLFQLPPSLEPSEKYVQRIEKFVSKCELGERFALEWRNMNWFTDKWIRWAENLGITLVSIDSPDFPREIYTTNNIVYLRLHGRTAWYSHYYTEEELEEIAQKIVKKKPEKAYIYLNNNHGMLPNAQTILKILKNLISK